ncbi:MAG: hypothetical protein R3E02_10760 [Blastomonas sp.]
MRFLKIAALILGPLLLSGCLLSPGKFDSDMMVQRDGGFTFTYRGEIYLLGLGQLIELGAALDEEEFTPGTCYGEPDAVDAGLLKTAYQDEWSGERECTEGEIEQQRLDWEDAMTRKREEDARNMEIARAFLGGIDPSSDEAIDELTSRISKQKGWNSITHKGDGLFEVDYAVSGRLDQDYSFPVLERTQGMNPLVVAVARKNGAIRIDAPGYIPFGQDSGLGLFATIFRAMGSNASASKELSISKMPDIEGNFTIRTNAPILTNNTDDGPEEVDGMQVLRWTVNARQNRAPQAMLQLGGN